MSKLIFIIGTGRSGTHLVGRSVSSHPEVDGRIESPSTFNLIAKIASRQDIDGKNRIGVLKCLLYVKLFLLRKFGKKKFILEKSHPSIWLVDFLARYFKDSYFVAVVRDMEPTVSSMLQHKGIQSWYKKLPLDKPNRFLGITSKNQAYFSQLSLEEKLALRWLSHKEEIDTLRKKYPDKIFVVRYEEYMVDHENVLRQLADFLRTTNSFMKEEFKTSSLDKWKTYLRETQVSSIREIVKNERSES